VRTAVLSDLHLAAGYDGDLLRRARFREILMREIEGADEVLLLGDVIELRDRPLGDALEMARWRRRPPTGQTIAHSDHGAQGELNRSSQHRLAGLTVGTHRGPRPVSSSRGSCEACC